MVHDSEGVKTGVTAVPVFDGGVVGVPGLAVEVVPKLHDSDGVKVVPPWPEPFG
jgi:hypothetical protein